MSVSIFDKVLKIIGIVVTILQVALKALTGLDTDNDDSEHVNTANQMEWSKIESK